MKRRIIFFIAATVFVLGQELSFAKIDITPSVSIKEEYTDNIFLTRSDKEHDYITTVSPNIMFQYSPNSLLDITLNYGLNFKFYDRFNEYNDTSLKNTQNIDLRVQARPLNRFFIDVFDVYKRTPIDIRRRFATGNAFLNMTENNTLTISPSAIVPLSSTFTATLGYKYKNLWYESDENVDSEDHTGFLTLSKRFSSKLTGELKYEYFRYIPDSQANVSVVKDYDRHQGSVAAAFQITPDLTLNGEIGRARYDYKEDDSRGNLDIDFWNINTNYNLKMTGATSLGAGYAVSLKDSPAAGAYKSRKVDVFLRTGNVLKVSVTPYYSDDDYFERDREDRITGISSFIMYPLAKKIDLQLNGQWERQKFLPENEKVRKYNAGIVIDYKYSQKIIASLEYKYDNRNSDNDNRDFNNNTVSLQAKIIF